MPQRDATCAGISQQRSTNSTGCRPARWPRATRSSTGDPRESSPRRVCMLPRSMSTMLSSSQHRDGVEFPIAGGRSGWPNTPVRGRADSRSCCPAQRDELTALAMITSVRPARGPIHEAIGTRPTEGGHAAPAHAPAWPPGGPRSGTRGHADRHARAVAHHPDTSHHCRDHLSRGSLHRGDRSTSAA